MIKKILLITFFIFTGFFSNLTCFAEENITENKDITKFDAKVVYVGENTIRIEDIRGNRYDIDGTFEFGNTQKIEKGMKIKAEIIKMEDGGERYIISDINRLSKMWIFIFIFFLTIVFLLKKQGIKALANLIITFLVIIFFIIPLILKGFNPLVITVIGTSLAMFVMFFTLYGKSKKTLAICLATLISLTIATLFSWFFIHFTYLTGFANDEATFLMTAGYINIDMEGLLLAAFLIGIMGTLDDIIINQVSIIESLKKINPKINIWTAYKEAMKVGKDHMASMINTLIFAYAGAAFPLMILFYLKNPPFDSINSIINNEIVATEIVRMIVGSMSLLLATPIATYIAVKIFLKKTN